MLKRKFAVKSCRYPRIRLRIRQLDFEEGFCCEEGGFPLGVGVMGK
jgi:hypothetical protein